MWALGRAMIVHMRAEGEPAARMRIFAIPAASAAM
jgi:hypothetical protein